MTYRTLYPFFAVAFGLTWGLAALLLAFPAQIEGLFGPLSPSNPLYILAVYAPALAAIGLVLRHHGLRGLGAFFKRFTLWRLPLGYWLLLLLGIPALFYLGAAIKGSLGDPFPFAPWYAVLPALAFALVLGPVEELGWRGVALPLLQRRLAPFWASVVLGAIWGLWHAPAFLLSGAPHSAWSFGPFFLGAIAITLLITAMFNASAGSLAFPVLFHFQTNGPMWPDAQPWDTLTFGIVAALVVILNWKTMFARDAGVTTVLSGDRATEVLPEALRVGDVAMYGTRSARRSTR